MVVGSTRAEQFDLHRLHAFFTDLELVAHLLT